MVNIDQRGNPSPIWGEGQGRRRRRGALSPSLPVAPECHRGPSSSPQSSPTSSPPSSPTLPPSMQRCNPSFTHCNIYLNMVLNAIYYFPTMYGYCRCQNRRISGRGSRTMRLRRMVTGDKGHDVFTQVRALSMEVKPNSCLIDIDEMGSTRVDLPRDQGG